MLRDTDHLLLKSLYTAFLIKVTAQLGAQQLAVASAWLAGRGDHVLVFSHTSHRAVGPPRVGWGSFTNG